MHLDFTDKVEEVLFDEGYEVARGNVLLFSNGLIQVNDLYAKPIGGEDRKMELQELINIIHTVAVDSFVLFRANIEIAFEAKPCVGRN